MYLGCVGINRLCKKRHPTVLHIDWSEQMEGYMKTTASGGAMPVRSSSLEKMDSHMGAGETDVTMAIMPVSVRIDGKWHEKN